MKCTTVLVALDMSKTDQQLIQSAYFASRYLGADHIYFVHATPPLEFSSSVQKELNHLYDKTGSIEAQIRIKLQEEIEFFFPLYSKATVNLLTKTGNPFKQLANWIKEKQPDLLIVGKKQESEDSGITPIKLARKADCAIWFVPEASNYKIKKVLVPLDYSAHSARALQTALVLKKEKPTLDIIPCAVYDIPLPKALPADYLQQIREEQMAYHFSTYPKFLEQYDITTDGLQSLFLIENKHNSISKSIQTSAVQEEIDLMIMGAKGHSVISSTILGSVTEKMVSQKGRISVLVIR